jgi:hypothetical protein
MLGTVLVGWMVGVWLAVGRGGVGVLFFSIFF